MKSASRDNNYPPNFSLLTIISVIMSTSTPVKVRMKTDVILTLILHNSIDTDTVQKLI